jgi:hypothetical protein
MTNSLTVSGSLLIITACSPSLISFAIERETKIEEGSQLFRRVLNESPLSIPAEILFQHIAREGG